MKYLAQSPLAQAATLYIISERFRDLPLSVRTYFQKVFLWLPKHEGSVALADITAAFAKRVRNKAARERGHKFGNFALAFVQAIVADNKDMGVLSINRVRCVPKLRTPALEMRDRRQIWSIRALHLPVAPKTRASQLND